MAADAQLQKTKMLDQNFQKLKLFANEPLFKKNNTYNLFKKFEESQLVEGVVSSYKTV